MLHMNPEEIPPWRLFWAKTFSSEDGDGTESIRVHPLWAHLIDVANASDLLWEHYLPSRLKESFLRSTGVGPEELRRRMSLWIGLHDVGKAIPGFQVLHEPGWTRLEEAGLEAKNPEHHRVHHGHATAPALFRWIEETASERSTITYWKRLAAFVSYHHGRLCGFSFDGFTGPLDDWTRDPRTLGPEEWGRARSALISNVAAAWTGDTGWPEVREAPRRWPPWLLGFAGWATLADWIGSMSAHYPKDVPPSGDLGEYVQRSRKAAKKALEETGLTEHAPIRTTDFSEMFGFSGPRPLQMLAGEVDTSTSPSLTIIEAPTGEGKTEAAFRLAARQRGPNGKSGAPGNSGSEGEDAEGRGSGIYVGMPTQATSNGLFPRFEDFLRRSCDAGDNPNLVLVHGSADLHPSRQGLLGEEPDIEGVSDADGPEGSATNGEPAANGGAEVRTKSWFLPQKRSLLASYGVGTVDQTFLGTLYSRHFFLRLLGLAGKTVIFDEVHAYDTYMSRLFEQLLEWLKALGTDVILLSATLPSSSRNRMLRAWEGGLEEGGECEPEEAPTTAQSWRLEDGALASSEGDPNPDYPALWRATEGTAEKHVLAREATNQRQEASVSRQDPSPSSVASEALSSAEPDRRGRGACVAVIVNTVSRAQQIYEELQSIYEELQSREIGIPEEDVWLLHARFPHGERARREEAVVQRFGPEREPGKPGILVATQVAEQSLDLDFDLMFSDLAPIDLLFQRAGRLHRHLERHRGRRPEGLQDPVFKVMCPPTYDGWVPILEKHGMGFVYDTHVLYRTWHLLREEGGWSLPEDYRPYIEEVYERQGAPESLADGAREKWTDARQEAENRHATETQEARARIIPSTDELRGLAETEHMSLADDEDPDVHRDLQALTRWSEIPSVEVICLHRDKQDGGLYLDRSCTREVPLERLPEPEATREVMEQAVRLSSRALAPFLQDRDDPAWEEATEETPALRHHERVVFEGGRWESGSQDVPDLRLDPDLGLLIRSNGL